MFYLSPILPAWDSRCTSFPGQSAKYNATNPNSSSTSTPIVPNVFFDRRDTSRDRAQTPEAPTYCSLAHRVFHRANPTMRALLSA